MKTKSLDSASDVNNLNITTQTGEVWFDNVLNKFFFRIETAPDVFTDIEISDAQAVTTRIKIGEILFGDLNGAPVAISIDIKFPNAKPADRIITSIYGEIIEVFVNGSGIDIDGISSVAENPAVFNPVVGFKLATPLFGGDSGNDLIENFNIVEDIIIKFKLSANNPQDWTDGRFDVYMETKEFPTLTL